MSTRVKVHTHTLSSLLCKFYSYPNVKCLFVLLVFHHPPPPKKKKLNLFSAKYVHYRLLLYLSLFGFTLEPRVYRSRFAPPKTFLQRIDFTTQERQKMRSKIFPQQQIVENSTSVTTLTASTGSPALTDSTTSPPNTCNSGTSSNHVSSKTATSNSSPNQVSSLSSPQGPTQRANNRSSHQKVELNSSTLGKSEYPQTSFIARLALGNFSGDRRYTWEHALMLPATPEEVRIEVEILLSDLIVRLKQLLFNSLLCAYYVGFIPMLFADVSAHKTTCLHTTHTRTHTHSHTGTTHTHTHTESSLL